MKTITFLLAVLCCGIVAGAEIPDFSKAEAWKKSGWSKSIYTRSDAGVLSIDRKIEGSGAWCTVPFAVNAGEKIAGTVDIFYVAKEGKGVARLGLNFLNAEGKRVLFYNVAYINDPNGGFETKKFSFTAPAGATQLSVYVCVDGIGKAEFRNLMINK